MIIYYYIYIWYLVLEFVCTNVFCCLFGGMLSLLLFISRHVEFHAGAVHKAFLNGVLTMPDLLINMGGSIRPGRLLQPGPIISPKLILSAANYKV